MRAIRVALVHRDAESMKHRIVGPWAYPVPEFVWEHFTVPKWFTLDAEAIRERIQADIIWYEDAKAWGSFSGDVPHPICYWITDSTLSDEHYTLRCQWARKVADLVFVDWDRLARFRETERPVYRFNYCVNDRMFYDRKMERVYDVAFICNIQGDPARIALARELEEFCATRGYRYVSGSRMGEEYARIFNQSKILVNLNRTSTTRNHRLLDGMASRTCVLTSPVPDVSGEEREAGIHYVEFFDQEDLFEKIDWLLGTGKWQGIADAGYELAHTKHTWAVRAKQLRATLLEAWPSLKEADYETD